MKLDQLIEKSYGCNDGIFAGHSWEQKYAQEALLLAIKDEISFEEYMLKHEEYLKKDGCVKEHISEQLKKVAMIESYFK